MDGCGFFVMVGVVIVGEDRWCDVVLLRCSVGDY